MTALFDTAKKNLFFKLKAPFQWVSWAISFQVFHDSKESQGQKRKDGFFGNATSHELRSPISSSSWQRLPVDSFGTLERAGQWDTPHYSSSPDPGNSNAGSYPQHWQRHCLSLTPKAASLPGKELKTPRAGRSLRGTSVVKPKALAHEHRLLSFKSTYVF